MNLYKKKKKTAEETEQEEPVETMPEESKE